jgi:diguanylate cyclase (GGDEF)-like protein
VEKFCRIPGLNGTKLFLNIDNRGIDAADIFDEFNLEGIADGSLVIEISECHPFVDDKGLFGGNRRGHSHKIAIDDFGAGFSGLQLLYAIEPDFVKIDRFFISDIGSNVKKRMFLSTIVRIAHMLGAVVIAEGVETEREFFICKDIGCDLIQGYLVQRPTTDITELSLHYTGLEALSQQDRRVKESDRKLIASQIEVIPPVKVNVSMPDLFQRFRASKSHTFLPVIDEHDEPLGIVRESDLKDLIYSRFGKELISNKSFGYTINRFLRRSPIIDVHTRAEKILETFSVCGDGEGIIIVDNMKYVGFLSASSLLKVINEKNIAVARDQNPLTRLPGNNIIHEYVSEALAETEAPHVFVYLDFDNFKPFNDAYGFRQGDRAILLFADIARRIQEDNGCFVAHIGGDDFFLGLKGDNVADAQTLTEEIIKNFSSEVSMFYDPEARELGGIIANDRDGNPRKFELMTVSAAVLHAPSGRTLRSFEEIGGRIAELKKEAKKSPRHVAVATIN